MEVIQFSDLVVSAYNSKCKKNKSWLFKLIISITFTQLLMPHACIKVQNQELVVEVSVLEVHGWYWRKNHVGISGNIEIPFLIYPAS